MTRQYSRLPENEENFDLTTRFGRSAVLFVGPRLELLESLCHKEPIALKMLSRQMHLPMRVLRGHLQTLERVGLAREEASGLYDATEAGKAFHNELIT